MFETRGSGAVDPALPFNIDSWTISTYDQMYRLNVPLFDAVLMGVLAKTITGQKEHVESQLKEVF